MAPAFMARTLIGMSPWPVRKTIGIRDVPRRKLALKIESAQSRQSDIKHKATRRIWQRLAQKGIRRVKALNL